MGLKIQDKILLKSKQEILHSGIYSPPFYFRPFCPSCQRPNWKVNEFKIILKLSCQSEGVSMTQLYLDKLKTGRTRLQVKKHEKKKANHKNKHEANIALYTINNIQPQHRKKRSISQQLSFNKSTKADFIIFMSFRSW